MKQRHTFFGFLLIIIGLLFLGKQFNFSFIDFLLNWQWILIILGLFNLVEAIFNKGKHQILPGIILLGLGIHFLGLFYALDWPSNWGVYPFIVGIAFIVSSFFVNEKGYIFIGVILLIAAFFGGYYDTIRPLLKIITNYLDTYWPIILILLGIYIIYRSFQRK